MRRIFSLAGGAVCRHPKAVAVGEIGLDYYWDNANQTAAEEMVRARRWSWRWRRSLPIIVHSREAAQETFELISQHHAQYHRWCHPLLFLFEGDGAGSM